VVHDQAFSATAALLTVRLRTSGDFQWWAEGGIGTGHLISLQIDDSFEHPPRRGHAGPAFRLAGGIRYFVADQLALGGELAWMHWTNVEWAAGDTNRNDPAQFGQSTSALLLLFSVFGSVWDAVIILFNMPVALLGGLVGLAAAGMTLSVSAAVGFIALLGQAVLNGVLVVSAIRTRLDHGEDAWTATIEGARDRLRAVLMTAMLASLGLLPAALSHAIGSETQRPIAMVVVSGTISAALLTLVVLPVSYYWAGHVRAAILRFFHLGAVTVSHQTVSGAESRACEVRRIDSWS